MNYPSYIVYTGNKLRSRQYWIANFTNCRRIVCGPVLMETGQCTYSWTLAETDYEYLTRMGDLNAEDLAYVETTEFLEAEAASLAYRAEVLAQLASNRARNFGNPRDMGASDTVHWEHYFAEKAPNWVSPPISW